MIGIARHPGPFIFQPGSEVHNFNRSGPEKEGPSGQVRSEEVIFPQVRVGQVGQVGDDRGAGDGPSTPPSLATKVAMDGPCLRTKPTGYEMSKLAITIV